jgi:hypothetical protein
VGRRLEARQLAVQCLRTREGGVGGGGDKTEGNIKLT